MTLLNSNFFKTNYRPDIDGLRAIAILSVVIFHYFPNLLNGGFIGVDIFFVISGFLITTIILENLERGTFSFSKFYIQRIRRIFPALIFVLLICSIFGWLVLLADELNQLGKHIVGSAVFISNFILSNEEGYFNTSSDKKPLLHLWSLAIEEQFYIIWPFVLWLAWGKKNKFLILIIIIIIITFSFALNIKKIYLDPVETFYYPQTRFWELMCGSLISYLSLYKRETLLNLRNKIDNFFYKLRLVHKKESESPLSNIFSCGGLILLIYGFCKINKELYFPGYWALIPVIGAILVIVAGVNAYLNRLLLSNKIFISFGLISYPLYLWHWPILSFGKIIDDETLSIKFRILAFAASILLSWLTVKLIEKPFRFGANNVAKKVIILCSILFAIGLNGYIIKNLDLSNLQTYEKLKIKRKDEYLIDNSFIWFRGKNDWLFLGNEYNKSVAKLKLGILPKKKDLEVTKETYSNIAKTAASFGTEVVLIIGPNKSSIYPENLPDTLKPSTIKYSSFFLDILKDIPNLTIYDPTNDLLSLKEKEGILYWRTDTHWNKKGAFLAYSGFLKLFNIPIPDVSFYQGDHYEGDLLILSKLKNFTLYTDDNWEIVWKNHPVLHENQISREAKKNYDAPLLVCNYNSLSNKYIWMINDSFGVGLKQFFNNTFKDVLHIGDRGNDLKDLVEDLIKAERKPNIIVIVKVERSF